MEDKHASPARPSTRTAASPADWSASVPPIPATSNKAHSRRFRCGPIARHPGCCRRLGSPGAQGDLEARAERGEFFDRLQPLDRVGRDRLVRLEQQISISPVLVAADPAAELVQIGQAVFVSLVDEDRVHVGDIKPALDDRGRHQDVELPLDECEHRLFKLFTVHLAMGDADSRFRNDRLDQIGDGHDVIHTVVDEIDLAFAIQLAEDRSLDDLAVEASHPGLDRLAIGRRRFKVGDIADAEQAHVQRTWNRRGGKCQDIDGRSQALQPLLVFHAEPLLLVDDHQAQVFKGHVFLQDPVRADQDIDAAGGGTFEGIANLGLGSEAVDGFDREGKLGHAGREATVVLLGEDRGRDEHRYLLAGVDGLERGPDRDLGFAVADVAADQAVHRLALRHVVLDRLDGRELVWRLFIRKGRLELGHPVAVFGRVDEARRAGTLGLDVDQFLGQVNDRFGDAFLPLFPRRCTDLG